MKGDFVIPGEVVSSAEEFVAKDGTYLKDGRILSSATGMTNIDRDDRSATVVSKANEFPKLSVGDVIVGQIVSIRDKLAIVSIAFKRGYESRPISNTEALIHVSNIKNSYLKDIAQAFSQRDIVKAKIIKNNPLDLSTKDNELGVVKAYCSRCATPLRLEGKKLVCPNCGNKEDRKLSTDYGTGVIS